MLARSETLRWVWMDSSWSRHQSSSSRVSRASRMFRLLLLELLSSTREKNQEKSIPQGQPHVQAAAVRAALFYTWQKSGEVNPPGPAACSGYCCSSCSLLLMKKYPEKSIPTWALFSVGVKQKFFPISRAFTNLYCKNHLNVSKINFLHENRNLFK